MKVGTLCLEDVRVGTQKVQKIMEGTEQIYPSTGTLYAEFTMADTSKLFHVNTNDFEMHQNCAAQYSSDNVNWTTVPGGDTGVTVSGSLKWYVRQHPEGVKCTYIGFGTSEFNEVNQFISDSITVMNYTFGGCKEITTVPMFDTSNVTRMQGMFNGCIKLDTVPLFDTSKVYDMSVMFSDCDVLTSIPLFNTVNVTGMQDMMYKCPLLTSFPLLNTINVEDMTALFKGCTSLVNIPALNTSNNRWFRNMFEGCSSLVNIPIMDTSKGTLFGDMFRDMPLVECIPALNTTLGTNMTWMFLNSDNILHPNYTEQKALMDVSGGGYIYTYDCANNVPSYVESFNGTLGAEWSLSGWNIYGGNIHASTAPGGDATATLSIPVMANSGRVLIEISARFQAYSCVLKVNGVDMGIIDTPINTRDQLEYNLPAGNNVIEFIVPGSGMPPSNPAIFEVFSVEVIED